MAQTVIGIFDNAQDAQQAAQTLINQGFDRNSIDISSNNASTTTGNNTNTNAGDSVGNFFSSLFGNNTDDYNNYSETARQGGTIVTVHAQNQQESQTAATILDQYNAIDVDARVAQYRSNQTTETTSTLATTGTGETARTATAEGDVSVPVIEENLQVGKQVVERGGARLRSRIIERPVEESLRLREEHVRVERNPVDRPATEADFNRFSEGEVEITERAEVPVVAKEARVVEEVSLGKEVTERQETVSDTVRKTEVEVEELNNNVDDAQTRSARP